MINADVGNLFVDGKVLIKIISSKNRETRDHTMEIEYEDYVLKYNSHQYIAAVSILPLEYKISYIYGCLNMARGIKRDRLFSVWYRKMDTPEWKIWFFIHPYVDD